MRVYLDEAATSQPPCVVVDAMMPYLGRDWGNPSSPYSLAYRPSNVIQSAREEIAEYIGAKPNEIYFTSGGSESNCWAIQGYVSAINHMGYVAYILASTIEHHSIDACGENLDLRNSRFHYTPVDRIGHVDLETLELNLKDISHYHPLVTIQLANNEIGTIQDMKKISDLVHRYGGVLHTDAVAAFGKIPIDVDALGIDMMSVSGHKIGAPKGIGFLYVRNGIRISPLIYGSQQNGMRGGTQNVPYIAALRQAVRFQKSLADYDLRMTVLRNNCISRLKALGCTINGDPDHMLPNHISATFHDDIMADNLIYLMDTCGVYISAGAACDSSRIEPSHVLKAICMSDLDAYRTIRITLPYNITMDEIDYAMDCMAQQIKLMLLEKDQLKTQRSECLENA